MLQNALTVIMKIKPNEHEALKDFLAKIGKDIKRKDTNKSIQFESLITTHFARWVIINECGDPHLMFSSNHDGTWQEYIDHLIDAIGPAIDDIWGHCEGYPTGRADNLEKFRHDFKQYIWKHYYEPDTFYLGYRGVKVTELKGYLALQEQIQSLLDLVAVRTAIDTVYKYFPLRAEVQQAANSFGAKLKFFLTLLVVIVDAFLRFLYLVFIHPIQLRLRGVPRIHYVTPDYSAGDNYEADLEDVISQNQMTVVTKIKPWRLIPLRFVLCFIHSAAKHMFNQGSLSSLATIHFARWIIIDGGTHLLFESNYDSTWESYIGDFIDKVSDGMNAVWRHSVGFPNTTGIVITQHGCKDVEAFKHYIRQNQIQAQIFYSAYPKHTVRNLLAAIHIGKSLARQDVVEWLRRF
jgi:hypothetical protein